MLSKKTIKSDAADTGCNEWNKDCFYKVEIFHRTIVNYINFMIVTKLIKFKFIIHIENFLQNTNKT